MSTNFEESFAKLINKKVEINEIVHLKSEDFALNLEQIVKVIKEKSPNYVIHFKYEKARGDGKETLFQPLGRYLLNAKKNGRIRSCVPSPEGDGFFVVI
tara:strand:+ start:425 stop:721 length:297 start_codon:yes stop_codon:yes gene_type:complete